MGIEQLNPQERNLLRSTPRQDPLLGYWQELLEKPSHELREQRTRELTALRDTGTPYHYVSRVPVNPGYETWFRNVFPEIRITVLSGSGHFPHIAQPEALVKILSGWKKWAARARSDQDTSEQFARALAVSLRKDHLP
jgi:hypothetical protein